MLQKMVGEGGRCVRGRPALLTRSKRACCSVRARERCNDAGLLQQRHTAATAHGTSTRVQGGRGGVHLQPQHMQRALVERPLVVDQLVPAAALQPPIIAGGGWG